MQIHRSDHADGVRVLRLDRPPANAINTEFLRALHGHQKYMLQAEANHWIHAPVEAGTERYRAALADPAAFARLLAVRGEARVDDVRRDGSGSRTPGTA